MVYLSDNCSWGRLSLYVLYSYDNHDIDGRYVENKYEVCNNELYICGRYVEYKYVLCIYVVYNYEEVCIYVVYNYEDNNNVTYLYVKDI